MSSQNRRGYRLISWLLIVVWLVTLVPPIGAAPQVRIKLNPALSPGQRVLDFRISPDGSRIAYRVTRPTGGDAVNLPADLFTIPATGGAAVQISPTATGNADSVESYEFSPDGTQILFARTGNDVTLGNFFELMRTASQGTAPAVSISGPIAIGNRSLNNFKFAFSQDAILLGDGSVRTVNFTVQHSQVPERISSVSDGTSNTFFFGEQVNNLNQIPLTDGSVRRLNPPLTNGGVVYAFQITPDGTRAIYRADQNLDGTIELFSIPADGSDAGFRIQRAAGGGRRCRHVSGQRHV